MKHNRLIWNSYKKANRLREARGDKKLTYKQFENRVAARKVAEDVTLRTALRREVHSHAYTSGETIAKENFLESLKEKHKDSYKELKMRSRNDKGQFVSLQSNITWHETEVNGKKVKGFEFTTSTDQRFLIDITNSPEEVEFIEL